MNLQFIDPDMPAQQLRLHMGEMTAQEMRTARAAIRWTNSRAAEILAAAQSEIATLRAKCERYEARLEIDHYYVMEPNADGLTRVQTPEDERGNWPDGIECRDATIQELERLLESLTSSESGDLHSGGTETHGDTETKLVEENGPGKDDIAAAEITQAWAARKDAEARVIQEYQWGNLTKLGVANHLRRVGFSMQAAVDKANTLPDCEETREAPRM